MNLGFHHFAISVPDLEATIAWYGETLGFEVEDRTRLAHVPAKVAFLRRGDLRIEVFEAANAVPLPADRREPDSDLRTHGAKHIAFSVSDVRAVERELRARGADVVFLKEMPGCIAMFVRDNSGILLEFLQELA